MEPVPFAARLEQYSALLRRLAREYSYGRPLEAVAELYHQLLQVLWQVHKFCPWSDDFEVRFVEALARRLDGHPRDIRLIVD